MVGERETPAVARRLHGAPVLLGDLYRDPDDRDNRVAAVPVLLLRGAETLYLPDEATALELGDVVLSVGTRGAFGIMAEAQHYDHVLEYLATGELVPATALGRLLRRVTTR